MRAGIRAFFQPLQNGIIGDVIPELPPKSQRNLHRHSSVVGLVGAWQTQCDAVAAVVDTVFSSRLPRSIVKSSLSGVMMLVCASAAAVRIGPIASAGWSG